VLIGSAGAASNIAVGSPAWFAWLEDATTFAFSCAQGSFTARKERRGQTGWYWKAYRKHQGTLQRAYLGKSADLSLDRLTAIASDLAQRSQRTPPHESRSLAGPTPRHSDDDAPPLTGAALPEGTLTFCFSDIEGSTQLWQQHPQAMPHALARHDAILKEAIQTHGGVVFKTVGDGVYTVFVSAPAALAGALAVQHALQSEQWSATGPLRVRMALHSGAAELRDGDYFGPTLNRVARLLAAGHGGQILLSQATAALVRDALPAGASLRDLGSHSLKDLLHPEVIFQLVTIDLPAEFPPLRAATPGPTPTLPPHLLATKLYVPPARPDLVPRPRLVERLSAGLSGKLTLIAAPAGFGKTTLVSAWIAETAKDHAERDQAGLPFSVAWVSLDALDNDPIRFWSYVSAALNTLAPGSGDTALALLQAPQSPPLEAIVTTLLNGLSAALPRGGASTAAVLVLDDYHAIEAPPTHRALATLVEHLPPQVHLLIATRADPPLPLARLRAGRQLSELRAADLRFSVEEASAFLTAVMGLSLSEADIAALEARTEGWIAGLQLAALAMRDRSDLASFIDSFTGSNRFVMHYLAEEVFARQPSHLQTFLLHTAMLDRMCGPLCDAVLGLTHDQGPAINDRRSDTSIVDPRSSAADSYGQLLLEELERANLFLVPLDDERHWYRYHHLFAEMLRQRLTSGATSEAVATLHRRASTWFEAQRLGTEAVQHALAARDWERAAQLIEQTAESTIAHGQIYTVLDWLTTLPDALIRTRPMLCLVHANILMLTNQLQAAQDRLQAAEHCIPADMPTDEAQSIRGFAAVIHANIMRFWGDLPASITHAQRALDLLPETAVLQRAIALLNTARAYKVDGDVTLASERLATTVLAPVRVGGYLPAILGAITNLARLQTLQGRLSAATATYAQALLVSPGELQTLVNSAAYYFGMADIECEQNHLSVAERLLAQGMDLIGGMLTVDADVVTLGYLVLARVRQASGDAAGARAALDTFAGLVDQRGFFPLLIARGMAAQAWLALAQGNTAEAMHWAETSGLCADDEPSYPREIEYLTLARVHIKRGDATEALRLLDRLLITAETDARMHSVIEILVLRALALQTEGNTTGALVALERALTLAAPEGYVRMFVDEGMAMARLLQAAHAQGIAPTYISKLLAAFPEAQSAERRAQNNDTPALRSTLERSNALAEPLTERELEILRLIAEGLSNQAIAERLVIAVSTVKRHINNLYGKLAVESRTQALVRARELQLL
jgi:LuxR family maltose regulon positive regulatory protein